MTLTGSVPAGTRVGRYEIVALLGRGGMGEVYSAHDSNLGRRVALKILPGNRTSDPDRVARFVREARASSALNHPSIVSVHDAGSEGNVHFLAMELIDGESLTEWMRKSRKPARAVELMAQVAEGLARAHSNGIVHRDLKPDNIMISRDGYAKIVDFGVAKLTERLGPRTGHTGVTTPTSRIGTTAYMSPEQVEGRAVDHRSDVFAFGTVLYELLAGRNPFASPQYADTLHNIIHLEPPLDKVPASLQRILRRCLRKDPEERYQSMKDAALDLRETLTEADRPPSPRRVRWPVALAAFVAASAVAASWYADYRQGESPIPAGRVAAPSMLMTRLTNSGKVQSATISPDGNYLVYAEDHGDLQALYVKQIATGTTTRIIEPAPAFFVRPRVSGDGNYIYYASMLRAEPNVTDIFQIPILGGAPRRIAADTEEWFSLSPDGSRVVFTRMNAFEREFKMTIASTDGAGEEVILRRKLPEMIGAAVWAPDGQSITFVSLNRSRKRKAEVHRLTLATRRTAIVPMPTWPGVGSYAWLPDGSGGLVTAHERDQPPQIWFVPTGSTTGQKVTSEVSAYHSVSPTADSQSFVTVRDTTDSNVVIVDLDRSRGEALPVTSGVGNYWGSGGVRWLGDGKVLYSGIDGGMNTFFVDDAAGGTRQRLIRNVPAWNAAVSPDGSQIAFVSDKSGQNQIWVAGIDGENARQITNAQRAGDPSFSADGKSIIHLVFGDTQYAWRTPIDGGTPEQLTFVPTSRVRVSPDGKWLLCRLRAKEPDGGPLWRTSVLPIGFKAKPRHFLAPRYGGGPHFQWHPDGKGFLFLDTKDGVGNVWLQQISGGEPRQVTAFTSGAIFAFELAKDGRQLVISRGHPASDAVLVRNWR